MDVDYNTHNTNNKSVQKHKRFQSFQWGYLGL